MNCEVESAPPKTVPRDGVAAVELDDEAHDRVEQDT